MAQPCINTFPYYQNFEANNGGWTAASITSNGLGPNSWVWASPAKPIISSAASGVRCWVTGNNPNLSAPLEPYSHFPNEFSAVTSPCFDFSGLQNPGIRVKVWWECEYSQDGVVLQASVNNGPWQRVGRFGDPVLWYNDNFINGSINGGPGGQGEGWTGTAADGNGSGGWVEAQHRLDNLGGQANVRLRFAFSSDANTAAPSLNDGFAFDDIVIGEMPTVSLGPDQVICYADTAFLNACVPSGISYAWNTNPFDTLCTKVAVQTGSYVVTVTDTLGFIVKDTFNLTVSSTQVNLPTGILICPGDVITLDAGNPSGNHTWFPGAIPGQTLQVSSSGTYRVVVTDNFGCLETDSVNVAVDIVPVVDLGNDTTVCAGESIILDAGAGNPGIQYAWSPIPATTQTVFVSAPGQYAVQITTAAGCTDTDTVQVSVALDPVVNLGPDRIACGTITLNAGNPGSAYLWSTGQTGASIQAAATGIYWVQVTNPFGCSTRDSVSITAGSIPQVSLPQTAVICEGLPVQLNAGNPGMSYFWSNGAATQQVSLSAPGTYTVSVTNSQGCTGRDTVTVVESTLAVDLGPDRTICEGTPSVLNAGTSGSQYLWSTGSTANTLTITTGGTYHVRAQDASGCVVRDTVVISSQPNFTASFTPPVNPVLYAPAQFAGSSSGANSTWSWNFGDGNTSTQQNPVHTYNALGTFNVCLTVRSGVCVNTVCQPVTVNIFQSLEEELDAALELWPNPAEDAVHLRLELPAALPVEVEILDLKGAGLHRESWAPASYLEARIPLTLSAGLYLVKVQAGETFVFRKLRVQ